MSEIVNQIEFQKIISVVAWVLSIITIAIVVGVVIVMMLDIAKAVMAADDSARSKAFSSAKLRLIQVVIFLLVPTIVAVVMNLIGAEKIDLKNPIIDEETGEVVGTKEAAGTYGNANILEGYIDFGKYIGGK